jgi:hypothetical protein
VLDAMAGVARYRHLAVLAFFPVGHNPGRDLAVALDTARRRTWALFSEQRNCPQKTEPPQNGHCPAVFHENLPNIYGVHDRLATEAIDSATLYTALLGTDAFPILCVSQKQ